MPMDYDYDQTREASSTELTDGKSWESSAERAELAGDVIDITCGQLRAKLHKRLFICPGIHVPCIEIDGEIISPKTLTFRANKDKQKDWKGSIRIGKSSMRTLIEMNTFDFYNHAEQCSSKCQSRNYINPKSGSRKDTSQSQLVNPLETHEPPPPNYAPRCGDYVPPNVYYTSPQLLAQYNQPPLIPHNVPIQPAVRDPSFTGPGDQLHFTSDYCTTTPDSQLLTILSGDPVLFWGELQRVGLLTEVVNSLGQAVERLRASVQYSVSDTPTAFMLSRLAVSLNMQTVIVERVHEHQMRYLRTTQPVTSTIPSYYSDVGGYVPADPMGHNPLGLSDLNTNNFMNNGVSNQIVANDMKADVPDGKTGQTAALPLTEQNGKASAISSSQESHDTLSEDLTRELPREVLQSNCPVKKPRLDFTSL